MQVHVNEFFNLLATIWPLLAAVAFVWMRLEVKTTRIETTLNLHCKHNGATRATHSLPEDYLL